MRGWFENTLPLRGRVEPKVRGGVTMHKITPTHCCAMTSPLKGEVGLADQLPLPPHLPEATLKLPQDIGLRQSEIRSLESGR